jgi:hypothetical protein
MVGGTQGEILFMNRMENGESDLLEGMNRSIRSDVCLERENLLRRIVVQYL